jgi:hypothetical protein
MWLSGSRQSTTTRREKTEKFEIPLKLDGLVPRGRHSRTASFQPFIVGLILIDADFETQQFGWIPANARSLSSLPATQALAYLAALAEDGPVGRGLSHREVRQRHGEGDLTISTDSYGFLDT